MVLTLSSQPKILTDAWEKRKLGTGFEKIGDGLHGTPKYSDDGEFAFINGNNLVSGIITITEETKTVTKNELSDDDLLLDANTFLYSINGTIGNAAWYRGEKIMLGKSAAYFKPTGFDRVFSYYLLQSSKVHNHFMSRLTGTTIKNLGLNTIRETPVRIPSTEEQHSIGSLFRNLDDTIALHHQRHFDFRLQVHENS